MYKKKNLHLSYDKENQIPVIRCSICTGEKVAGFKDVNTGKFRDLMIIKDDKDIEHFMLLYGIEVLKKEY